jgi:hypothetical protein
VPNVLNAFTDAGAVANETGRLYIGTQLRAASHVSTSVSDERQTTAGVICYGGDPVVSLGAGFFDIWLEERQNTTMSLRDYYWMSMSAFALHGVSIRRRPSLTARSAADRSESHRHLRFMGVLWRRRRVRHRLLL